MEGPAWRENDGVIARLLEEEAVQPFRMVFLVDSAHESTESDESFLWTVFTRFEPAADIHARETRLERFHVQLSSPVAFDCRMKPWYPPALEPLPETIARVDRLWPAIFGDGGR